MSGGDGFDFSAGDLAGIWNEGIAQMAACYNLLATQQNMKALLNTSKQRLTNKAASPLQTETVFQQGFVVGSDIMVT